MAVQTKTTTYTYSGGEFNGTSSAIKDFSGTPIPSSAYNIQAYGIFNMRFKNLFHEPKGNWNCAFYVGSLTSSSNIACTSSQEDIRTSTISGDDNGFKAAFASYTASLSLKAKIDADITSICTGITITITYNIEILDAPTLYIDGVSSSTNSSINLSWDNVYGASGYNIYKSPGSKIDRVTGASWTKANATSSDTGYYYVKAYNQDSVEGEASRSVYFAYQAAPQNTAPKLGSVTCSPSKVVSGVSTRVTFTFSVTDNGIVNGAAASITSYSVYSNSALTSLVATGSSNGITGEITTGGTYYCVVSNGADKSNTVSVTIGTENPIVATISDITFDTKFTIGSDIVVKNIKRIVGKVTRNDTDVVGTYSWKLVYGVSKTSLTYSVSIPSSTLILSNGVNPYNLTLSSAQKIEDYPYYKVVFTATVNSESKSAETEVYAYPAILSPIGNNGNGYNSSSGSEYITKANTVSSDLNDVINLQFNLPACGVNRKPDIESVILRVAYQRNTSFSIGFNPNATYTITSYAAGANKVSVNLEELGVPRGYYGKFKIAVQDKMGQSYETDILDENNNAIFYRINLPTFGANGRINLNYNQTISVNQLLDSDIINFALPSINTYIGSLTLAQQDIYINYLKQLKFKINNSSITQTEYSLNLNASDTTFEYNEVAATGYFNLTGKALKNLFSNLSQKNEAFQTYLELTLTDIFGNTTTVTSKILLKTTAQVDYIYLAFGTPPEMEDYTSTNYKMYLKYRYSGSSFTEVKTGGIMVNPGDKIRLHFPKGTDSNGAEDIKKYRIKVIRKDSMGEELNQVNDFIELKTFNITSDLTVETNGYTCEFEASNYQVSKFIRIGVCAIDSTELESNLIVYPITLIGGRVAQGRMDLESSSIEPYNGTDGAGLTYTLRSKIIDLGANLFNNKSITYADYPNFERTMDDLVSLSECRDVIFDLFYSKDNSAWGEKLNIPYKIDSTTYNSYPTSMSYSTLLTKTIKFEPISLIGDESDSSGKFISITKKNYFYLRARIQNGFNEDGSKSYSYIQSEVFVLYPSTPVVAYRQNYIGINTRDFGFYEPYEGLTYDATEHYYVKSSTGGYVEVNPSVSETKDQYYIKSRNHSVVVAEINNRNKVYFVSGEDRVSSVNISTGELNNFIIDGGDWDTQYLAGYLRESSDALVIDENNRKIEPIGGEYKSEFSGDTINTFVTDIIGE